jgi:hypothetical protein
MDSKEDHLWKELIEVENISDRRSLIFNDVHSKNQRYKILAETDPFRLFEILGGDESEAVRYNWAFKYTYEDYLEDEDAEYDQNEKKNWDLEEKSVQRSIDSGYYYITGGLIIEGAKGEELEFELQYTEGYFDGIRATPYGAIEDDNEHGIMFD